MIHFVPESFQLSETPTKWGFSSLREFEVCQLRWKLSRSTFARTKALPCNTKSLPAVQGELVHQLLQEHALTPEGEVFRPRKTLKALKEHFADEHLTDSPEDRELIGRLSLNSMLLDFERAKNAFPIHHTRNCTTNKKLGDKAYVAGVERWLKDTETGLCGRIDYYWQRVLVDYKSGQHHDWHCEQLRYYSALIAKVNGEGPVEARLVYSSDGQTIPVDVPDETECSEILLHYQSLIHDIRRTIERDEFRACHSKDVCSQCPVRVLCDSYWEKIAPQFIRDESSQYIDISTQGSGDVNHSGSYSILRAQLGEQEVSVVFPHHLISRDTMSEANLEHCRVYNARRRGGAGSCQFVVTDRSHIFFHKESI